MELKDNNFIKYIDVTEGCCVAYVRCDTADASQAFVQKNCEGKRLAILKGKKNYNSPYAAVNILTFCYAMIFQTMKRGHIGTR